MIRPIGLILAVLLCTVALWKAIEHYDSAIIERTRMYGILTLFWQTLDAVTTMVAIDLLNFSEQVTLSRLIIEATPVLPGVAVFESTWLFGFLKVALGTEIVIFVSRAENPDSIESRAILVVATAGGLVPGFNNLLTMAV